MKNVCAAGSTTFGYDVSHWQSDLHVHSRMKLAGAKFCLIKCDEGVRIHDAMFRAHWNAAKAAGMITGAYNFFHPAQDPVAQAQDLIKLVGPLGAGDLGAICDDEAADAVPTHTHRERSYSFLSRCQDVLKKPSTIYGSPYYLRDTVGVDSRFSLFLLWIAHYKVKCPLIPDVWPTWDFWQYTETGGLDLNVYNGPLEKLRSLTGLT